MRKGDIRTRMFSELNTKVVLDGREFIVDTENVGKGTIEIVSKVYLNGEIVSTYRTGYGSGEGAAGQGVEIGGLMKEQHERAIQILKEGSGQEEAQQGQARTADDYVREVKTLLRRKNTRIALSLLEEALNVHPEDPSLLYHYGYLVALIQKKYDFAIRVCQKAIKSAGNASPSLYADMCLYLGRVFLLADMKKEAIEAFRAGVKKDRVNNDLRWELKKLGLRKAPVIPFLGRSNPINKYLGKIRHMMNH